MCSVKEKDTETFPHELTLIFQRLWGFHFFQPSFQLLFYCFIFPNCLFFHLMILFFFSQPSCLIQNSVSNIKRNLTLVTVKRLQVKGGIIIFAVVFLEYSIVSFPMTALFFWISCLLSRSRFLPLMSLVFFATVLCAFESRNASPHKHVCIWSSCLMLI